MTCPLVVGVAAAVTAPLALAAAMARLVVVVVDVRLLLVSAATVALEPAAVAAAAAKAGQAGLAGVEALAAPPLWTAMVALAGEMAAAVAAEWAARSLTTAARYLSLTALFPETQPMAVMEAMRDLLGPAAQALAAHSSI
jgi:hypothetical protein